MDSTSHSTAEAGDHIFHALADRHRRDLLGILKSGDRSVSGLSEQFSISQPAISQHLKVLRDAGLVRSRKEGRQAIYSLDASGFRELSSWLAHYERFWSESLDRLQDHLKRKVN